MKIGGLQTVIVALVVIGIVLGVGMMVLDEFFEEVGSNSATVVNETTSGNVGSTTATVLAHNRTGTPCFHNLVIIEVTNATGDANEAIDSTNYTVNLVEGTITATADSYYIDKPWNISYSYSYGDADDRNTCDAIDTTIDAELEVGDWIGLVVILLIVGILLFLVFKSIAGRGEIGGAITGVTGSGGTTAQI